MIIYKLIVLLPLVGAILAVPAGKLLHPRVAEIGTSTLCVGLMRIEQQLRQLIAEVFPVKRRGPTLRGATSWCGPKPRATVRLLPASSAMDRRPSRTRISGVCYGTR